MNTEVKIDKKRERMLSMFLNTRQEEMDVESMLPNGRQVEREGGVNVP